VDRSGYSGNISYFDQEDDSSVFTAGTGTQLKKTSFGGLAFKIIGIKAFTRTHKNIYEATETNILI
jgi:hypothetical protein